MAAPQRGIFEEDSIHHHYLEYAAGEAEAPRLVAALARAYGDARALSEASGTRIVVAFGADLWRRSAPFGSVGDKGHYFLAFACEIERFDVQLRRMFGTADDGVRDRLTDYSRAVTGAYWFAPSEEALESVFRAA